MLICLLVAQNNVLPSIVIAVGSKPMSPLLAVLQYTGPSQFAGQPFCDNNRTVVAK